MIAILHGEPFHAERLVSAFGELDADIQTARRSDELDRADRIVVPSGDSFAHAARFIRDRRLVASLRRAVADGRPVLAVSLGMHLFFDCCAEAGEHSGLGVVGGRAARFDFGDHPAARHFVLPHQGWNQVHWRADCPLMAGLESGEHFYFEHTAHAEPADRSESIGTANHGVDFSAIIRHGSLFGVEFLPERSGAAGRSVLENFITIGSASPQLSAGR